MERLVRRTVLSREHQMPYGTIILPSGDVCFRLWAPQAKRVDVVLYGTGEATETVLAMEASREGWYTLTTTEAVAGTRYHFQIDGDLRVPDPVSRYQPEDVHEPSQVIDPRSYRWEDDAWKGRPWEETVFYELHVGTFTPEGTFKAAVEKLDYLKELGVTALEIMPVADFPGRWNWGYDGALLFAPDSSYGTPDDFKDLVQAAHERGMMVFLDVVYNHFGPEGNYLYVYAKSFFNPKKRTPWGDALNFDGDDSGWVRKFFVHNALFWLEEYHLDGLRLDAVHAIHDESERHFLEELSQTVHQHFSDSGRQVHVVLENEANQARYLNHKSTRAQWNDDFHHTAHVLLTGERSGYYVDYDTPQFSTLAYFCRALTEGFAYQGESSSYRGSENRGEISKQLPLTAFVNFIQNHDQVGNRAMGDRLLSLSDPSELRLLVAAYLLSPSIPMLFMGEEFGCEQPFQFFCDLGPDLAPQVTQGRRSEFKKFPEFSDPETLKSIPDPCDEQTVIRSQLDWAHAQQPDGAAWLSLYKTLLSVRHEAIVPRLMGMVGGDANYCVSTEEDAVSLAWILGEGSQLSAVMNLAERDVRCKRPTGDVLWQSEPGVEEALVQREVIPARSALWVLNTGARGQLENDVMEGSGV